MREERLRDLIAPGNWAQVNGDAGPGQIRDYVRRLVNPSGYPPDQQIKTIVATKAIGHGFDVARLGVMVMMGTPTQASEVIQASARVGRRQPGLVINIATRPGTGTSPPTGTTSTGSGYLDRLIHKVPINRESLPGPAPGPVRRPDGVAAPVHDRGWVTGGTRRRSLADSDMLRDALNDGELTPPSLTAALPGRLRAQPGNVLPRAAPADRPAVGRRDRQARRRPGQQQAQDQRHARPAGSPVTARRRGAPSSSTTKPERDRPSERGQT